MTRLVFRCNRPGCIACLSSSRIVYDGTRFWSEPAHVPSTYRWLPQNQSGSPEIIALEIIALMNNHEFILESETPQYLLVPEGL